MFADERLNNKRYESDYGNYWGHENYFYGKSVNITSLEGRDRRVWEYAWYGIRVANLALEKLEQEGLFEGNTGGKRSPERTSAFFPRVVLFRDLPFLGGDALYQTCAGSNREFNHGRV